MLRRLCVRTLLVVGGIGAALLGLEIVARFALPEWAPTRTERDFWMHDPRIGWRNRPGSSGRMEHRDFAVDIETNAEGMRDGDYPLERVPGKRRMVLLGDSFGWGFGVEQEEIFAERIEARRSDLEVINGSVSGWSTDQQLLWFESDGRAYRPDIVLLLVFYNDFTDNVRTFGGHKPLFELDADGELHLTGTPLPPPSLGDRVRRWIDGNTYFLRRLYAVVSPNPTEMELNSEHSADALQRMQASSELTRALLLELERQAREVGARLVVASVPMHPGLGLYLRETLAPVNVPYLALDEAFTAAPEATKFAHDLHWTPYGHSVAADAIEDFLVAEGLLEPRR